jgi:deoxyribodipyrimidine photo-lyase
VKKTLVWLKRDLRVFDQPLLRDCKNDETKDLLVYFRFSDEEARASVAQNQFRESCLSQFQSDLLRKQMGELNQLMTTDESFSRDLETLLKSLKPDRLLTSAEFAAQASHRNLIAREICEKLQIEFNEENTFTLFPEPELDQLPLIFTEFRKKVESAKINFRDLDEALEMPEVTAGMARLNHYLFNSKRILTYKETRNGMIDPDDSSHFSPYLAFGAISVKRIWSEIDRFEAEIESNSSTAWLKFELLWREFFVWNAKKYQMKLFELGGIRQKPVLFETNATLVEDWKMGRTPNAFVNANMNELRKTGWMSNRGRQNVASYFIHDLGLEWRLGARWFEEQLIDAEPCANWGNWSYLAGVGNDPRPFRKFNLEWQQSQYDPAGEYTRLWTEIKK